jgi:DNA polymerase kappa
MKRIWIHVDMDCLLDKPIAVGDNNMIMTANYVARKYGVRSGIPGFIGKKLCSELIFIKPNYPKYRVASEEFKSVLRKYDH